MGKWNYPGGKKYLLWNKVYNIERHRGPRQRRDFLSKQRLIKHSRS